MKYAIALCCTLLLDAAGATPAHTSNATQVPLRYEDNRIMIRGLVDGRGPFTFVLDTGASGDVLIDSGVASALHLPLHRAATISGAGNRPVRIFSTTLHTLQVGSLVFAPGSAAVADLSEIRHVIGFRRLDGIVGTQIFQEADVEINVDDGYVRITKAHLRAPDNAHRLRLSFFQGLPQIQGTIDRFRGPMIVDTGDHSTFTLFNRFVKAHPALRSHVLQSNVRTGVGLGGPIFGDYVRLKQLTIAGFALNSLIVRASRQREGVFSSQPQIGSIGDAVLRRFNLIFDYRDRRMDVWPSATCECAVSASAKAFATRSR